jgi:ceramide glucosyltransferase
MSILTADSGSFDLALRTARRSGRPATPNRVLSIIPSMVILGAVASLVLAGGGDLAAFAATGAATAGLVVAVASWIAVARFVRLPAPPTVAGAARPPVTILKPLCGDEPMLEAALASCFAQAYPTFQIVFGLHTPDDPALPIVRRLQARHPEVDVTVVVDPTRHGANGKVSNLINMIHAARHEVLVISDSDLHVPPVYLDRLATELDDPGVGLVTAAYVGLPAAKAGLPARLGAAQVNHAFLPGVLIARAMGREDCLGSTVMIRRETLERIGGFRALDGILAEDNVLGQKVRRLGLSIRLARTLVGTTFAEASMGELWGHELRWARTIRAVAPGAHLASTLQYPLFWAILAVALSGGAPWAGLFLVASWMLRVLTAGGIDSAVSRRTGRRVRTADPWMAPVRDVLSVAGIAASFFVDDVVWRGRRVSATAPMAAAPAP